MDGGRKITALEVCQLLTRPGFSNDRPRRTLLRKAVLKTHALQTLRDCRASLPFAKRLDCGAFTAAVRRAARVKHGPRRDSQSRPALLPPLTASFQPRLPLTKLSGLIQTQPELEARNGDG